MTPIDIVTYAVPFFVALVLAEMVWAARRAPDKYEPRDTFTSLALGLGSTVAGALAAGGIWFAAMWLYDHRVATVPLAWWAWALCFVLDDFNYYLFHRSGHRVRWFWASHVNHHTSQHYNLSTALRQTWTGPLAGSFLFRIWPAFIGFHPAMILTVGAVNLVYQFWIHTEAIGRMPRWFEALFNTPSHHRVHHATNPLYLDRNYAGVFIVWDRLFGTFQRERDDLPIRYGTVKQLGSFHLLHAAFHEWRAMLGDVWCAPWRHKLSYLVRAPGWSHDGSREGSDAIRARWVQRRGIE
ncbi:sterol desaturase/sphingolipid hydroxylase (fatty acid hydroxylase superfamily) [Novosphingobium hassiacum]|uniref:Sterol desaturase/sphingolipid hydroxylase (Fatty acid hydroxylase superfamily) n=1 Tax=Novosphingobium hassiacum TaxID=173676 RepID=A0A7W6A070_9SPHN|nr:sterol desaturase family protein [Novosphingobium hassiacum]MBB3862404.1 sterol desaturase/sphingolipid hydroxylase (fatty acid hydroxylase superfamily) [Novosphingobium hassiacum]